MSGLLAKLTGKSNDSNDSSHSSHSSNSSTSHSSSSSTSHSSGSMSSMSSGSMGSSTYPAQTTKTTQQTTTQYGNAGYNNTGYNNTGAAYGSSSDEAMTRSEERLRVGKEQVGAGSAALDKYVTNEHVQTSVPVTKERVVVEREPITEANRDAALSGPDISEAHHEVHLTEERAIANKETVPIERIRLGKQVETEQQAVGAELRKEHVDLTTTGVNEKFDNIGYGKTMGTPVTNTTNNTTTDSNMMGRTAPRS